MNHFIYVQFHANCFIRSFYIYKVKALFSLKSELSLQPTYRISRSFPFCGWVLAIKSVIAGLLGELSNLRGIAPRSPCWWRQAACRAGCWGTWLCLVVLSWRGSGEHAVAPAPEWGWLRCSCIPGAMGRPDPVPLLAHIVIIAPGPSSWAWNWTTC